MSELHETNAVLLEVENRLLGRALSEAAVQPVDVAGAVGTALAVISQHSGKKWTKQFVRPAIETALRSVGIEDEKFVREAVETYFENVDTE